MIRAPKGPRREASLVRKMFRHPQPQAVQVRVSRLLREGLPTRRLEEAQARLRLLRQRGNPHGGEGGFRERGTKEEDGQGQVQQEGRRKEEVNMLRTIRKS